jgi:hypothetical protein
MNRYFGVQLLFVSISYFRGIIPSPIKSNSTEPSWLINHPEIFKKGTKLGTLTNEPNMIEFASITDNILLNLTSTHIVDGEVVDALEQFFWGKCDGLAIELGALDGSEGNPGYSMTFAFEKWFNWKRILIEGNPLYKDGLRVKFPLALSANAVICPKNAIVHYSNQQGIGGVLEYMDQDFLRRFHRQIFYKCVPPGNLSSLNFASIKNRATEVQCVPLSHILHRAHVKHVNFILLDVEGGELSVLQSIIWEDVIFDVLCIENEPSLRPTNFTEKIVSFLSNKGYIIASAQQGRNIWFTNKNFIPSKRPGIIANCFNGVQKTRGTKCPAKDAPVAKDAPALGGKSAPVAKDANAIGERGAPVAKDAPALGGKSAHVAKDANAIGGKGAPVAKDAPALGRKSAPIAKDASALGGKGTPALTYWGHLINFLRGY